MNREMSRREDPDSYVRRTRFRTEREPSPKRSRRYLEREETRTTERSYYPRNLRNSNSSDLKHEYKAKETERIKDSRKDDSKRPIDDSKIENKTERDSDPKEFARSKFYFQHDDQGREGGQVHIRRETDSGRKSNVKESKSEDKPVEKYNEKLKEKKNDESAWTHDRYLQMDFDSKPINKNKIKEPEFSSLNAAKKEERKPSNYSFERRENNYRFERRESFRFDRTGEGFGRGNRNVIRNGNEIENRRNGNENMRGGANLGFRGRGQFTARERFGGAGIGDRNLPQQRNEVQNEKWKHDMYEELNKRNPVNEEEQISKVEALLAS